MSNGNLHLFSKTKGRRRRLPLWLHLHILQERSGSTTTTTTDFISYLREPSRQHYGLSTLPTTRLKVLSEGLGGELEKRNSGYLRNPGGELLPWSQLHNTTSKAAAVAQFACRLRGPVHPSTPHPPTPTHFPPSLAI